MGFFVAFASAATCAFFGGAVFDDFGADVENAVAEEAEFFGGGAREVKDAAADEGAAIVDADIDGATGGVADDADDCAEGQGAVCRGEGTRFVGFTTGGGSAGECVAVVADLAAEAFEWRLGLEAFGEGVVVFCRGGVGAGLGGGGALGCEWRRCRRRRFGGFGARRRSACARLFGRAGDDHHRKERCDAAKRKHVTFVARGWVSERLNKNPVGVSRMR